MAVLATTQLIAHSEQWGAGGWWPVFPVLWFLFLGVVIFVVLRSRRDWGRRHAGPSPENVLRERYARGEIGDEEYRERLAVLTEPPKSK